MNPDPMVLETKIITVIPQLYMAGNEGFEPPDRSSRPTVFKTAALNLSANFPYGSDGRTRTYDRQGISLELLPAELHHYINELNGAESGTRTLTDMLLRHTPLPNWANSAYFLCILTIKIL